jgi:hypothetical protein
MVLSHVGSATSIREMPVYQAGRDGTNTEAGFMPGSIDPLGPRMW